MRTKLFIIAFLCCTYSISFAQKRATYFISCIPIKFEKVALDDNQQNITQNSYSLQQLKKNNQSEDNNSISVIEKTLIENNILKDSIIALAKQSKNKYYIAYLFKIKAFDKTKMEDFNEYFNYDEIKAYSERNRKSDLLLKSKGYDSFFVIFSK